MSIKEILPTKYYKFIGDVYEYHGLKAPKGQSNRSGGIHSDNGWRLREKSAPYKSFGELQESLQDRPCPNILKQRGLYQFRDADGVVYAGMSATCIHDRLWKYGPKTMGTCNHNRGVNDTSGWKAYRKQRTLRGYTDIFDLEVRFFFMPGASKKEIDDQETYLLGLITQKHGFPIANTTQKYKIDPKYI